MGPPWLQCVAAGLAAFTAGCLPRALSAGRSELEAGECPRPGTDAQLLRKQTALKMEDFSQPSVGSELLQRRAQRKTGTALQSKAGAHAKGNASRAGAGAAFPTSTTYCYELDNFLGCWDSKPSAFLTPICRPGFGTGTCLCWDVVTSVMSHEEYDCDIDSLQKETPTTGRCQALQIYVYGVSAQLNAAGAIAATGFHKEIYCTDMVKNKEWKQRHLVKLPSDPPSKNTLPWYQCWPPENIWWRDKCRRSTRYLGEKCWGGLFGQGAGRCAGSDTSYEEYSTSCYNGRCAPYAFADIRKECECALIGINLIVACSSADDACGGHACVLSTGDGKKYCDYSTAQDW